MALHFRWWWKQQWLQQDTFNSFFLWSFWIFCSPMQAIRKIKRNTHAVSSWKAGKKSWFWRAGGRGVVTQEVCQASMNLFISKGSSAGEESLLRLCQLLLFLWHHLRSSSTAMGRQKDVLTTIEEHLRIRNKLVRQALAEFLGTLILVVSAGCSERMLSNPWVWGKLSWWRGCIAARVCIGNEPSSGATCCKGSRGRSLCTGEKIHAHCLRVGFGVSHRVGSEEPVGCMGASVYLWSAGRKTSLCKQQVLY